MPELATRDKTPKRRRASRIAASTLPDNQTENSTRPRLWNRETTLEFFGGIDVSTLYRGMKAGRYPRPVFVSTNVARWVAAECEVALDRLIAAKRQTLVRGPKPRGRKPIT